MSKFNRVHAMCSMARAYFTKERGPCELCPAWQDFGPGARKGKRGCRMAAEEMVNVAVHGNPWGKRGVAKHIARWRKRFNKS
jgi:hypothetical protein